MLENIALITAMIFCEIYLFLVIRALFSSRSEGHQLPQQKELDATVARYSKAIQKNPLNIKSYLTRSSAYISQDRLEDALADCDMVTLLEPDNHIAFLNRGAIYGMMGDDEKCINETSRCLELKPDHLNALINRAHTYARLGNINAALCDFARAIELEPVNPDHYFERGNCFLNLQKYSEAIEEYTLALQQRDKNWDYYFQWCCYMNRGFAFTKLGELKQARADYERALERCLFHEAIRLAPDDFTSYLQRGNLYYCAEQYQNALHDFLKVQKHSDLSPEQLVLLGYCYLNLGEVTQANAILRNAQELNVFEDAINRNPGDSTNFLERGIFRYYLEEFQLAVEDLTHAFKLGEQSAELLPSRGAAYLKLHEYAKAIHDFETAIQNHPDSPYAYNGLAWLLATCPDEAFRDGKQSLKLAKRNCELVPNPEWNDLGTLAAAYAATGSFDDAIHLAKESLARAPEHEKADCQTRLEHYERNEAYLDLEP